MTTKPKNTFRAFVLWIVKTLVGVALFIWLINKVDWKEIYSEILSVRQGFLWLGIWLTVPNLWIQFYKWRYLTHLVDDKISTKAIWASLLAGFSMGLITPGRLGETGKGVFIPHEKRAALTGMGIADKLWSQWALACLGLVALLYLMDIVLGWAQDVKIYIAVFGIFLVYLTWTVLFNPSRIRGWIDWIKRRIHGLPLDQKILSLLSALDYFSRRDTIRCFFFAVIFQIIISLQIVCFLKAFDEITLWNGLAAATAAMFIKSLIPIAIMDIGVRESSIIFFAAIFGIPGASAFNASVFLFLTNVLIPGIVGIYFLIKKFPVRNEY